MMPSRAFTVIAFLIVLSCCPASSATEGRPPEFPKAQSWSGRNTVCLPGGVWHKFGVEKVGDKNVLCYRESDDDGISWSEPYQCTELPEGQWGGGAALIDRDGEVQMFFIRQRLEGETRVPAQGRFLDMWHMRSTDQRGKWTQPQCIHAGYIGAISNPIQLANGRIVMPFGDWIAGRARTAPFGPIECTTVYSDDNGETWKKSPAALKAPVDADYNGDKVGACEPAIVQLLDGRVLMLMRTQAGWLYESWSDDGSNWSDTAPSVLHSSTGPPSLIRLSDGRIMLSWNNCEMPPKHNGQGVYGGRDALHAAIADPKVTRWLGFREIYRDPTRNLEPPKRGDRGTAYPESLPMRDGRVAIISGQGGRRALMYVDPQWLLETSRSDDFSEGLEGWSVFKQFGEASGWWRNRTQGAELINHPDQSAAKALHIRRPDEKDPDGAVWNFPSGTAGTLAIKFLVREGSAGGSIALTDCFFDPIDSAGERRAMFLLPIAAGEKIGEVALQSDKWHVASLSWDLSTKSCDVTIDGHKAATLSLVNPTKTGICYLRLRSSAASVDQAGWLVESVRADVLNP